MVGGNEGHTEGKAGIPAGCGRSTALSQEGPFSFSAALTKGTDPNILGYRISGVNMRPCLPASCGLRMSE